MSTFAHDRQLPSTSEAPIQSAESVTPHNSNTIGPYRALWVGVTGDVEVIHVGDTDPVTYTNVPVGWYPWAVKVVRAANTTADEIVGMR